MTQEEKQLLLQDISSRLQSGLKVCCINLSDEMPKVWDLIGMPAPHLADILVEGSHRFAAVNIEENIRPYLRTLSSMTEHEKSTYLSYCECDDGDYTGEILYFNTIESFDYLNQIHVDYRNLIPRGLAIEAPEGMYN